MVEFKDCIDNHIIWLMDSLRLSSGSYNIYSDLRLLIGFSSAAEID
jgi:hypothetical protein